MQIIRGSPVFIDVARGIMLMHAPWISDLLHGRNGVENGQPAAFPCFEFCIRNFALLRIISNARLP
jgi:hypothetical protein